MKKKESKYENYVSTTEQILRSTPEEKDKKKVEEIAYRRKIGIK